MRLGIIILARSNSSRLPGKILMKVKNSNLIDYVISIAKKIKSVDKIIVSTTINNSDDDLINNITNYFCEQKTIFQGVLIAS